MWVGPLLEACGSDKYLWAAVKKEGRKEARRPTYVWAPMERRRQRHARTRFSIPRKQNTWQICPRIRMYEDRRRRHSNGLHFVLMKNVLCSARLIQFLRKDVSAGSLGGVLFRLFRVSLFLFFFFQGCSDSSLVSYTSSVSDYSID